MGPTSNGQRGTRTRLQDRGGRSAYPGTRYWTRTDRVALLPSSHRAPRQLRTALVIKKDRWKKYISIYINIFVSQKCCVPLRNFEFSQKYCIPQYILHCFAKHFAKHLHSLAKVLCFLLHSLAHKTLAFSCKTIAFLQETLRLIGKTFAFNRETLHSLAKLF